MENLFISALVQAGSCHGHSRAFSVSSGPSRRSTLRRRSKSPPTSVALSPPNCNPRHFHNAASNKYPAGQALATVMDTDTVRDWWWEVNALPRNKDVISEQNKREMKELVNVHQKQASTSEATPEDQQYPQLNTYIELAEMPGNMKSTTPREAVTNPKIKKTVHRIDRLISPSLERIDLDYLFHRYSSLPQPRARHLSQRHFKRILRAFAWGKHQPEGAQNGLRFLAVLDDMKAGGVPVSSSVWNSAIWFAGQCVGRFDRDSVQSALTEWKQMENEAGIRGGIVTFTVLFNLATKAEKFVLADMIYNEMVSRGLKIDRFTRLARIYYHGKRGDGEAVRYGYAKFVDAGEIVTTSALTCVIDSLLNAGEPTAAEEVFERMKEYHDTRPGSTISPDNGREEGSLHRLIAKTTTQYINNPSAKKAIQLAAPIGPNVRTYKSLIRFYARDEANLDRIIDLLEEMDARSLHADWTIYIWLFRAFCSHGKVRFTVWTESRLEETWAAFLKASAARPMDFLTVPHTDWVVQAFLVVSSRKRAEEVWGEFLRRWKPSDVVRARVEKKLRWAK